MEEKVFSKLILESLQEYGSNHPGIEYIKIQELAKIVNEHLPELDIHGTYTNRLIANYCRDMRLVTTRETRGWLVSLAMAPIQLAKIKLLGKEAGQEVVVENIRNGTQWTIEAILPQGEDEGFFLLRNMGEDNRVEPNRPKEITFLLSTGLTVRLTVRREIRTRE